MHRGTYPEHWPLLSEAVKRAAGFRCIRCGHPQGDRRVTRAEYYAGEGDDNLKALVACTHHCTHARDGKMRVLTVHHLNGDKSNDAWWNLLALCQVCHLQVQANVIPERPWLFEHTPWFKPYVAGYYAACHGIMLSRAEVEVDLEWLLLLGQPWRKEA
jgi:5-methylcytosine-specific restriction endonuclease McrA